MTASPLEGGGGRHSARLGNSSESGSSDLTPGGGNLVCCQKKDIMPENIPSVPGGALPPKPAEAAKVQPKKETVRINLPPKPTSAPTIKLPTLASGPPAQPAGCPGRCGYRCHGYGGSPPGAAAPAAPPPPRAAAPARPGHSRRPARAASGCLCLRRRGVGNRQGSGHCGVMLALAAVGSCLYLVMGGMVGIYSPD